MPMPSAEQVCMEFAAHFLAEWVAGGLFIQVGLNSHEFAMCTANKIKLVVLDEVSMLAMNPAIFQDVNSALQLLRQFVRLGQLWCSFLPARLGHGSDINDRFTFILGISGPNLT